MRPVVADPAARIRRTLVRVRTAIVVLEAYPEAFQGPPEGRPEVALKEIEKVLLRALKMLDAVS